MPLDILTFAYQIFKDFGCNVLLASVIIYLIWKVITNHLHHIGMDIKSTNQKIDMLSEDVKSFKEDNDKKFQSLNDKMEAIGERTSKIEGKIGI